MRYLNPYSTIAYITLVLLHDSIDSSIITCRQIPLQSPLSDSESIGSASMSVHVEPGGEKASCKRRKCVAPSNRSWTPDLRLEMEGHRRKSSTGTPRKNATSLGLHQSIPAT